uniref:30S ribosomal protein S7 (Trinotate prediction) n=1 Tax=Myxobolus squamalis TaxID=59785 RepID=A0A6B2FVV5_MYXSQ
MFCHNDCRVISITMACKLINGSLKFSRIFFRFIHNQDVFFEFEGEVFSQKFKNQRLPLPVSEKSPFYDPREMKFINHIMKDGKKLEAYSLYQEILKELSMLIPSKFPTLTEEEQIPKTFFFKALEKLKPIIEVKDVKIYGFDKKVSIPLSPQKSRYYASKNLITALFKKRDRLNAKKIALEVIQAYTEKGTAYANKLKFHRDAEKIQNARRM